MMSKIGPVRAVEVAPSAPARTEAPPTKTTATAAATSSATPSLLGDKEFDVHALLENMPQPRALSRNKGSKAATVPVDRGGGGRVSGAGGRAAAVGAGSAAGVGAGLNVDAWVQFASLRGFARALEVFGGRVLKKDGAELLCEYRLGVDVTGFMTDEKRNERKEARARDAKEVGSE